MTPTDCTCLIIDNSDYNSDIRKPFQIKTTKEPPEFLAWIQTHGKFIREFGWTVEPKYIYEMVSFFPTWFESVGWQQGNGISPIVRSGKDG